MKYQTLFKEYVWLVNTIAYHKRISFNEINQLWLTTDMSEGIELARSTFNRHKDAIEDIFGIYIDCDRRNSYKYYIGNSDVLEHNTIQNWMLSTMTVHNLLSENKSIHDRILLESIPSSEEYLSDIMTAMKRNVKIKIFYQKYSAEPGRIRKIKPFCVKLYKRRWYVVAETDDGEMRIFSLDRIHQLEITSELFDMPKEFDAETYFKDVIGVMTYSEAEKQRIIVRAFHLEKYYMRDLPIHNSQREVASTDEYTDFEYMLIPTSDLIRQLMSRGNLIQVIEPQWMANQLKKQHIAAAELYRNRQKNISNEK